VLQHIKRVQEISAKRDNFTGSTYRSALEQLSSYAEDLFEDKRQPYHNYAQIALDKIEQILKGKYKFDGVFGEQILFSDKDYVHPKLIGKRK